MATYLHVNSWRTNYQRGIELRPTYEQLRRHAVTELQSLGPSDLQSDTLTGLPRGSLIANQDSRKQEGWLGVGSGGRAVQFWVALTAALVHLCGGAASDRKLFGTKKVGERLVIPEKQETPINKLCGD